MKLIPVFKYINYYRDSLLIPILDCLTGFYAGFAIFTVLGSIAKTKCVPADSFADVVAGGPELAFIVYPEGKYYLQKVNQFLTIGLSKRFEFGPSSTTTVEYFILFDDVGFRLWIRGFLCLISLV